MQHMKLLGRSFGNPKVYVSSFMISIYINTKSLKKTYSFLINAGWEMNSPPLEPWKKEQLGSNRSSGHDKESWIIFSIMFIETYLTLRKKHQFFLG